MRVDGEIVRGCLMLAVQGDGATSRPSRACPIRGEIADLQAAFHERNALQCGFCTPGMLRGGAGLAESGDVPTRDEIREHLSGNYCRCTGYQAIVDAVEAVAQTRAGGKA